jgi:hypothetical protein
MGRTKQGFFCRLLRGWPVAFRLSLLNVPNFLMACEEHFSKVVNGGQVFFEIFFELRLTT